MESIRLPRFKRAPGIASFQVTLRDHAILAHVRRHRLLRSDHIVALLGGSAQQILRRLQLLYHHGYLERPRAQIEYYHHGGARPMVYGICTKAQEVLKDTPSFSR